MSGFSTNQRQPRRAAPDHASDAPANAKVSAAVVTLTVKPPEPLPLLVPVPAKTACKRCLTRPRRRKLFWRAGWSSLSCHGGGGGAPPEAPHRWGPVQKNRPVFLESESWMNSCIFGLFGYQFSKTCGKLFPQLSLAAVHGGPSVHAAHPRAARACPCSASSQGVL